MKRLLLYSVLYLLSFVSTKAQTNFINQDTIRVSNSTCSDSVVVCVDSIRFDDLGNLTFLLDGNNFNYAFKSCDTVTAHILDFSGYLGDNGPFSLTSFNLNGTNKTIALFTNFNTLFDSLKVWFPNTSWTFEPSLLIFIGEDRNSTPINTLTVSSTLNPGKQVNDSPATLFRGLQFNVKPGFHTLIAQRNFTNELDTVSIIAAPCVTKDTVRQTMYVGTTRAYCVSGSQLIGEPVLSTFSNICEKITTNVTFDRYYNFCTDFTGRAEGTDTACMRVCDQYGFCDTTILIITAEINSGRFYIAEDSVFIGENKIVSNLNIPNGTINIFQNDCPQRSGTNVNFTLNQTFRTISFTGVTEGVDTLCLRVCNTDNTCDTTHFYIKTRSLPTQGRKFEFTDTITNGLSRTKCIADLPNGTINVFNNLCTGSSGSNVAFSLDANTNCITYTGVSAGIDTACIQVCNTDGLCDTNYFYITAKSQTVATAGRKTTIVDSVALNTEVTNCNILTPSGTIASFTNDCTGSSGTNVSFSLQPSFGCINYRGLSLGNDTACVKVCNTEGVCDTTIIIVEAKLVMTTTNRQHFFADTITLGFSRTKTDFIKPANPTVISNICAKSAADAVVRFDINTANNSVTYTPLKVGKDTACIRICDANGLCDTTYMFVEGLQRATNPSTIKPSNDTIRVKIYERKTSCPDQTELAGAPVNVIRLCSTSGTNDKNTTFTLDATTKCITAGGLKAGVDTICVAICNTAGFCDTTNYYVFVSTDTLRPAPLADSVKLKIGELYSLCPDTSELWSGTITSFTSCGSTLDNVSTTINDQKRCIDIKGTKGGTDTLCYTLCNSVGVCKTSTLYLTISSDTVKPVSSTISFNLNIDSDTLICGIDTTQIGGTVDTIFDACPGQNGSRARMVLSRVTKCVRVTGLTPGVDRFCAVVTNRQSGLSDTTTIIVTVVDTSTTPITLQAFPDNDTLILGPGRSTDKPLFVYRNDTLGGKLPTSLTIISPPKNGKADTISFTQGIINYKASKRPQACGIDSFRYRVCIDTVCSEALVTIHVICQDTLKAYNFISPNGDNRNDVFIIEGLQNYPNNTVIIYNRWGNEVLKIKNYENDWQGTWNGKTLPDGTYFYMIRDDDKNLVLLTGYLQIQR